MVNNKEKSNEIPSWKTRETQVKYSNGESVSSYNFLVKASYIAGESMMSRVKDGIRATYSHDEQRYGPSITLKGNF